MQTLCDKLSDEDEPIESDVSFMMQLQALGSAAADAGGRLVPREQDAHEAALEFVKQKGLVQMYDNGTAALSPELLLYGVDCRNAVPEGATRESTPTSYEMSCLLRASGWSSMPHKKQASIHAKCFAQEGPGAYFSLLFHFGDALVDMEADGKFSHSQCNAYYEAVEAAVVHHYEDRVEIPFVYYAQSHWSCPQQDEIFVPLGQKAEFYRQLKSFLQRPVRRTVAKWSTHVDVCSLRAHVFRVVCCYLRLQ